MKLNEFECNLIWQRVDGLGGGKKDNGISAIGAIFGVETPTSDAADALQVARRPHGPSPVSPSSIQSYLFFSFKEKRLIQLKIKIKIKEIKNEC